MPWSAGDSLEVIAEAEMLQEFERDTILYPVACNPLARAAFNAELAIRETLLAPAGVYAFQVDSIYPGGRLFDRADIPSGLRPAFVNWTIKQKTHAVLGKFY